MVSSPVRLIAAILITCTVAALGLGATYSLTAERIAEQERIAEEAALREVLSGAATYERVVDPEFETEAAELTDDVFIALYEAFDEDGDLVGWGVRVAPRGYGGPIQMAVGLERDGQVTGASIVIMNETPGLGTKVSDEDFLAQFGGWVSQDIEAQARRMDAVTGATKSSNAVRMGVVAAGQVYVTMLADTSGGE